MGNHNNLWDNFGGKNPDIYDKRQEMESLGNTAREFYKLVQTKNALEVYRKAYNMAELIGDTEKMGEYKYWIVDCLYSLSRYKESLVEIFELLQIKPILPLHYFYGLIKQFYLAINIPIELSKIQSVVQDCYDFNRQNGLNGESMILSNKSSLASLRFEYEYALKLSMEALSKYDKNGGFYNIYVHYEDVLYCFKDLKQLSPLKEWLTKLQNVDTVYNISKQCVVLKYKAEIALLENKPETAYEYAKRNFRICQENDMYILKATILAIRTGIAVGHLDSLYAYLGNLFRLRNSESKHDQYNIHKTFGEYHAARYKRDKNVKDFKSAKKCFERALKIGSDIDQLLECNGRQNEILLLISEL